MAGVQFQLEWRGYRGPGGRFASQAQQHFTASLHALAAGLEARLRAEAPISDPGNVPPGRRPGGLRQGLQAHVRQSGPHQGSIDVTSAASYASYVQRGRGAIVAAPGRRLRFFYRGRWVYARRVRAVAPNDFVARAVHGWRPQAQQALGRLVGQLGAAFLDH